MLGEDQVQRSLPPKFLLSRVKSAEMVRTMSPRVGTNPPLPPLSTTADTQWSAFALPALTLTPFCYHHYNNFSSGLHNLSPGLLREAILLKMGQRFEQTLHPLVKTKTNQHRKRRSASLVFRKVKITTTNKISLHTQIKMKNTKTIKSWPECGATRTPRGYWYEPKTTQLLCRAKSNTSSPCLRASSPRYLPKRSENICLQEALYENVHSNFIYYSPKLEAIQTFISKRNDKQIVVYSYSGVCLSNRKK